MQQEGEPVGQHLLSNRLCSKQTEVKGHIGTDLVWCCGRQSEPPEEQLRVVPVFQVLLYQIRQQLLQHHRGVLHPSLRRQVEGHRSEL